MDQCDCEGERQRDELEAIKRYAFGGSGELRSYSLLDYRRLRAEGLVTLTGKNSRA